MKHVPHLLMELNSPFSWNWHWFCLCVDKAETLGYTGIIFHQQELISILAPMPEYGVQAESENLPHQKNYAWVYLKKVAQYLNQKNMSFWIQGESNPAVDVLHRKYIEYGSNAMQKNFWSNFYNSIIDSVLIFCPTISGVIFSVTIPDIHTEHWYAALENTWKRLRQHGKKFVVRDFFDSDFPRRQLVTVMSKLPNDVRASCKATELNFHPGFANNPHLTMLPNHPKWIEYEAWGLGYGWSYVPCYLVDEIQQRLTWAMSLEGEGIEAIVTKVSWQWVPSHTALDSVNIVNLLGLKLINQSEPDHFSSHNDLALEKAWLDFTQVQFSSRFAQDMFFASLKASHSWLLSIPNVLGRCLHYQSQIPENMKQAQQLIHMDTRSARRDQAFQLLFPVDDIDTGLNQKEQIQLEKEKSQFICRQQLHNLNTIRSSVIDPNGYFQQVIDSWEIAQVYGEMFQKVTLAATDFLWLEHYNDHSNLFLTLEQHHQALYQLADQLDDFCQDKTAPLYSALPLLLSSERLRSFADSLISS
ncbi:MAG: hypothetical protein ACK5NC_03640 [Vibrio sp.]